MVQQPDGRKQSARFVPAAVTFVVLLPMLLLAGYVAGYFWLGENVDLSDQVRDTNRIFIVRVYRNERIAAIFRPATRFESRLRGVPVHAWSASGE